MKPITPQEVAQQKLSNIPEFVIEIFNELIAENFSGRSSVVLQNDVVKRVQKKLDEDSRNAGYLMNYTWLNVEEIYEEVGWKVTYDQPGYNESYDATFTFKKK